MKSPNLLRRVAIYDLSHVYKGEKFCLKINETESPVFKEFERFLSEKYKIEFKPIKETISSLTSI